MKLENAPSTTISPSPFRLKQVTLKNPAHTICFNRLACGMILSVISSYSVAAVAKPAALPDSAQTSSNHSNYNLTLPENSLSDNLADKNTHTSNSIKTTPTSLLSKVKVNVKAGVEHIFPKNEPYVFDKTVPEPPTYHVDIPSYLSLEQAQQYFGQVSPKIAANNAAIVSNQQMANATKNLNKPIVMLGASAMHLHLEHDIDLIAAKERIASDINSGIDTNLPIDLPLDLSGVGSDAETLIPDSYHLTLDKNKVGANVTVLWSAYNGGKTQAVTNLLNDRVEESTADAALSQDELYTTLNKRYFTAQLAIMGAYLRNEALNAIGKTDHMAQRMLDVGLISKIDRLEAQKALADADYEAKKAQNDAQLALTALQSMLRTPYTIKPTTPLFMSSKPLPPLAYFQNLAKEHHPGFAKVAAKYQQARQLYALSESTYKPSVTVFGRHEITTHDPSWIAGVSANWKLWGGIDRDASSQANLARLQQAEFSNADVSDNIMLLVQKNWQNVNNAQLAYQSLNANVALASQVLKFRELGLKEGVNTAVEMMQAQTNLEKAKTEQARAANDYVQALADLMQSCGTPLKFNEYRQSADIRLPATFVAPN